MQPYGKQPTRLLCPRDSLGKNTGEGCHFLLHFCTLFANKSVIIEMCRNYLYMEIYYSHEHTILLEYLKPQINIENIIPSFINFSVQFSSVFSRVRLFATPWTVARQASLSITNSRRPPKPMSTELVMPSNHLILCRPLLLRPSIFPSIRVFSNESALRIRWPKHWSFSFNISPSIL